MEIWNLLCSSHCCYSLDYMSTFIIGHQLDKQIRVKYIDIEETGLMYRDSHRLHQQRETTTCSDERLSLVLLRLRGRIVKFDCTYVT